MSSSIIDWAGWRRAWGPALRCIGYLAAIYTISFIILIIPTVLISAAGGPDLGSFAISLFSLAFVFGFFLAIFKVMDEQRPGEIPLDMV